MEALGLRSGDLHCSLKTPTPKSPRVRRAGHPAISVHMQATGWNGYHHTLFTLLVRHHTTVSQQTSFPPLPVAARKQDTDIEWSQCFRALRLYLATWPDLDLFLETGVQFSPFQQVCVRSST